VRLRRLGLAVVGLLLLLATAPAPSAHAIETATFGLAPVGMERTALHVSVRPGRHVEDGVRVWNKSSEPITLTLSVQGARIDADGKVVLGGNGGATSWVQVRRSTVTLPPNEFAAVGVGITAPRNMPRGEATAAVVAEPAGGAGARDVAVLQRVALMVYVKPPAGSGLRAALGWIGWLAVALVVVAGGLWLRRAYRSRPAT
jgi:hypothetical protein